MQNTSIATYDNSDADLVDIRTVTVDRNLPKQERITEFIKQIRNPYHFRCGKFIVRTHYTSGGPSFEDCLRRLMA
jgi:hypothetical protein